MKEKTAEEMFKELGFKKIRKGTIFEIEYRKNNYTVINFYIQNKEYVCNNGLSGFDFFINANLHKAINQQLKELGWL